MASCYQRETIKGETGYSWLFRAGGRVRVVSRMLTLLATGLSVAFFVWYIRNGNDASPDSPAGFGFAIVGTFFLILAAVLYTLRRRSHKKGANGQLHASLQWHICFGVLGLTLLLLHSFGNFNPRSGTYALYGMIALVISGFTGRLLDRIMPRL